MRWDLDALTWSGVIAGVIGAAHRISVPRVRQSV